MDYTKEYYDINNWKLEIETNSISDFSIMNFPANLKFYLENWNINIVNRTSKKLEVLPGKVFGFWTLPQYSAIISVEIIEYFKVVFKQTQTNRGDNEDYWERQLDLNIEILEKYLKEIRPFVFHFDHLNYGYKMVQIQSRYETTYLRGSGGYDVNWDTKHTYERNNEKREFIRFEKIIDKEKAIEWLPIEDRKLYLFDNPKTGESEGFIIKKDFPEEAQVGQYDRVLELLNISQRNDLNIKLKFNQS